MKNLDDILKAAKPPVPELPMDFSERVMSDIRKLEMAAVPVNSTRQLVNWKQLIGGVLLMLIALIIVNNIVFEVRMNGSVELLYFGTRFLNDVFAYIPFDLIIPAIIVTGISAWLMWSSKALKRGIVGIIIGSYLTTVFGGAALATTGINEKIQASIVQEKRDLPLVSWFFRERARYFIDHPNFKMGRVERYDGQFCWIVDPHGHKSKIELPADMKVQKGQIIRIAGVTSGDLFRVSTGHHCNPGRVGRYFHEMSMMRPGMNKQMGGPHKMMKMKMKMKRKSCCTN